jgi:transcriptional regulator with XRE-family HTH domain
VDCGGLSTLNREELKKLLEEIKDPEYRRGLVEAHAKDTIAFQVRQLRKVRGWEQRDLARELGNPKLQPMISRYENPDYGRYSITTLLELAAAFDVALVVRFAPFSELVEWDLTSTSKTLSPPRYAEDKRLNKLEVYASQQQDRSAVAGLGSEIPKPQMGSLLNASIGNQANVKLKAMGAA